MHKLVASVLCVAIASSGGALLSGCKASAQIGSPDKKKKKEPPPPPPKVEEKKEEPKPKKVKKTFKMKGEAMDLPNIEFETGSDKIKPESDATLEIVREYLEQEEELTKMRIEGHTDADGDDKSNLDLSKRRAMAVSRWLTGKGIKCKRLVPVGFGEAKPVAANNNPEGKAKNRRTEFVNAARDGKAIDGKPIDGGGNTAGDPCN
jgi:OOP family OmpA-OmpF porin